MCSIASSSSAGFHLRGFGSLYFVWNTCIYLALAHTTSLEKLQGLVGLGLDQEEEPAVVDENTAYLHCGEDLCWICLWELLLVNVWGGGCIAEHWWHSLSVGDFLCSVSIWYLCWMAGIKWNSRSRLRQNTSLNLNFYLQQYNENKVFVCVFLLLNHSSFAYGHIFLSQYFLLTVC